MGSRIQPGKALTQQFHVQLLIFQINPVQIRDLQLPSGTGLQIFGVLHHPVIVEIQTCDAVIALGMLRLLFDGNGLSVVVKLHNAEPLRIVHVIAEHSGALSGVRILHCRFQPFLQTVSGENVVAQHHGHRVIADEIRADDEGLCQSVGTGLHCIGQIHSELGAVL